MLLFTGSDLAAILSGPTGSKSPRTCLRISRQLVSDRRPIRRKMASGTGAMGGTGQCYRFWLNFTECRVGCCFRRRGRLEQGFQSARNTMRCRAYDAHCIAGTRRRSPAVRPGEGRLHGVHHPRQIGTSMCLAARSELWRPLAQAITTRAQLMSAVSAEKAHYGKGSRVPKATTRRGTSRWAWTRRALMTHTFSLRISSRAVGGFLFADMVVLSGP